MPPPIRPTDPNSRALSIPRGSQGLANDMRPKFAAANNPEARSLWMGKILACRQVVELDALESNMLKIRWSEEDKASLQKHAKEHREALKRGRK